MMDHIRPECGIGYLKIYFPVCLRLVIGLSDNGIGKTYITCETYKHVYSKSYRAFDQYTYSQWTYWNNNCGGHL